MGFLSGLIGAAGGFLAGGPVGAIAGGLAGLSADAQQEAGQAQSQAAQQASAAQSQAAQAGIDEQRRQFDLTQKLLQPYTQAGAPALQQQQAFLGLGGAPAQQQAIQGIEQSPAMQAMLQQGENAMLQNASATGGLRGGNIQGALAQFRPQLLNQLINQQYERLGNLTSLGQQSAVGVGTAGQAMGGNVATLLGQQGAAQAGGIMGQAAGQQQQAQAFPQAIGTGLGLYNAMGGGGGGGFNPFSGLGGGGQMDFMGFKF
jgi:hypothetical protein